MFKFIEYCTGVEHTFSSRKKGIEVLQGDGKDYIVINTNAKTAADPRIVEIFTCYGRGYDFRYQESDLEYFKIHREFPVECMAASRKIELLRLNLRYAK